MSKFFQQISSSEESDDEDFEPTKVEPKKVHLSSESEEEERRVVKSTRDKRFDEMSVIIKNIKNHKKIKDISNVLQDFEDLVKTYDKSKKVIEDPIRGTPKFFVKCIGDLEDFVNESWEIKKTMSKVNGKALGILRQKIKKYNKDFEERIKEYRENPDVYEEFPEGEEIDKPDEGEKEDFDGGDDDFSKQKSRSKAQKEEESSDDDDSDWPSSSEDSSSSSDDEKYKNDPSARFLKKPEGTQKKAKVEKTKKPKTMVGKQKAEAWISVDREKSRVFEKGQEITAEVVIKKLGEIVDKRGKRNTDRNDQVSQLAEVETKINENDLGFGLRSKVLFHLISAVFDQNMNLASSMKLDVWSLNVSYLSTLLDLLEVNLDIITVSEDIKEEAEELEEPPYKINGCILTLVERMDDEYIKILQNSDAHSVEYIERLQDDNKVCKLIDRLCEYAEKKDMGDEYLCRSYLRKIEHLYYKFDHKWANEVEGNKAAGIPLSDSYKEMDKYCHFIYARDQTDRLRTRAILCHIYYLALHDYWFKSRDLMLMSNLQASIDQADIATMILYNRAMVQLGLCAFRKGFIKEAHSALVDMQSSGRAKELLAQGLIPTRIERSAEQEKLERRRQVPYHMHINLELLECVYLVSALLNEIAGIAAHEMDMKRRMISKNFHHVLKISERQTLVGPPETMREHIVAASKMMRTGYWKSTVNFIINDKMNAKVWDLFFQSDNVKSLLIQKIKEEALRVYLFTHSNVYESISLSRLESQFELDKTVVHSVVSKMILNEELMASLDEPSQCMVMHKTDPARMQLLALQLSEKVNVLAEWNERLADNKMTPQVLQKGTYNQPNQSNFQPQRRMNNRYATPYHQSSSYNKREY